MKHFDLTMPAGWIQLWEIVETGCEGALGQLVERGIKASDISSVRSYVYVPNTDPNVPPTYLRNCGSILYKSDGAVLFYVAESYEQVIKLISGPPKAIGYHNRAPVTPRPDPNPEDMPF